ncbi:MAG: DUF4433 domain-containing protein [Nitrospirota bacterium]|nr:DUF4433 domain-containing protein [Nitrospirota bacterium]
MERHELTELHYITPIANVPSILERGILSHNRAKPVRHESVAMNDIQDRRAKVIVPGGRKLHEYVNLYICARNPMMYKRQAQFKELCVLRVSPEVIDLPRVVVCDTNASSEYAKFKAAPGGLNIVNKEWTFAEYWTDPDQITEWKKKVAKCAEVLVPDKVAPHFITGAYVACPEAQAALEGLVKGVAVEINSHLFFR